MMSNTALAAFCLFNRRVGLSGRLRLRPIASISSLNLSQLPNELIGDEPSSASTDKDWFSDGREAARLLKMELGIMDDDADVNSGPGGQEEESQGTFATRDAALEGGRAAARALLQSMQEDDSEGNEAVAQKCVEGNAAVADTGEESDEALPADQVHTGYFDLPSRKNHCLTVCLVPPPSANRAWEQLTKARRECKDPGFFRWPPHANIVYPFLETIYDEGSEESKKDQRAAFRKEIALHLSKAASQCEPFDVTIDSFGTFGGKNRGVLWAYPKSKFAQPDVARVVDEEPLIQLHGFLEEQFPMCNDQRKGGSFHPHMTISHYVNNDDALAAKEKVEANWKPVSFHVPEIYLLERKGDEGQFKIAATVPLGKGSEVELHDPPKPLPAMPTVEEEWVYEERMAMKERRKRGNRRRRRSGNSKERGASDESQERKKQSDL